MESWIVTVFHICSAQNGNGCTSSYLHSTAQRWPGYLFPHETPCYYLRFSDCIFSTEVHLHLSLG